MTYRVFLAVVLSLCSLQVLAGELSIGPAIEGYGATYPIDDRDVQLKEGLIYKVVFDASSYQDERSMNTGLVSVARFMNMHARNGVPVRNMDLAVVVHGATLKSVLNHEAYNSRYLVDNPNLDLVMQLRDAGVKFYVCGQSMEFNNVKKSELVAPAKIALSAMTMLSVLQLEGYALLR